MYINKAICSIALSQNNCISLLFYNGSVTVLTICMEGEKGGQHVEVHKYIFFYLSDD